MNGRDMKKGRGKEMLALQQTGASKIMSQMRSTHLCVGMLDLSVSADGDPHTKD